MVAKPRDPGRPSSEKAKQTSHSTPARSNKNGHGLSLAANKTTGGGGGGLRSIAHDFKVNAANGSSSFGIPIHTSPSRSDFGPKLELSYDSGSGNGSFGIGWSLSGVSSITRKTSERIPTYDDQDVFTCAGMDDLVPHEADINMSRNDSDTQVYRVRRFSPRTLHAYESMRIERWTNCHEPTDVFWKTLSPLNITSVFGDTDASRIVHVDSGGRQMVFAWHISFSYDSFGNEIRYRYKREDSTGILSLPSKHAICEAHRSPASRQSQLYLKSIQYGNRQPNRNLETWNFIDAQHKYFFEVLLDYGEHDERVPSTTEIRDWKLRLDPFSTYKSGFELRNYRLCHRILMFHQIPERLSIQDYLVSSTVLEYEHSPTGAMLTSLYHCGHRWTGQEYSIQQQPPFEFSYSKACSLEHLILQTLDTSSLESFPGEPGTTTEWVDLDGQGTAGLLQRLSSGAWVYQRNDSAIEDDGIGGAFAPAQTLPDRPSGTVGEGLYFEDLAKTGTLSVVHLDSLGRLDSYHERTDSGWSSRSDFSSIPNVSLRDPKMMRIDLTGNGLRDLVMHDPSTNEIIWYECTGKSGFGPQKRSNVDGHGPNFFSDETSRKTYLVDMSGDGLLDIALVENGSVSYWPNTGNGKFGPKVTMNNSPIMDSHGSFTHARVRLADLDGSGTSDMLYFSETGGCNIFYNHAGNGWSEAAFVGLFPRIDNLSRIFVMDLLGRGTSCLCWAGPNDDNMSKSKVQYIDLNNNVKPYLMTSYTNGIGLTTRMQYKPSTWFHLKDERAGRPWRTKLPFPVHCIQRVAVIDNIAGTMKESRYAYHEGYYDGQQQEFRGFGMVEQWDTSRQGTSPNDPLFAPPRLKKSWFTTGARLPHKGMYEEDSWLKGPQLPPGLTELEESEAYRALKGHASRVEIFCEDGSDRADIPYTIEESRRRATKARSAHGDYRAVYRVDVIEVMTRNLERQREDVRVSHELILETNPFGDVRRKAVVHYGRGKSSAASQPFPKAQCESILEYVEVEYTDAIDENDAFLKPQLATEKKFRVAGWTTTGSQAHEMFSHDDLQNLDKIPIGPQEDRPEQSLKPHKIVLSMKRSYYRRKDLSAILPLYSAHVPCIVDRTYNLALTPKLIEKAYGAARKSSVFDAIKSSGYIDLDNDGCWWRPSEELRFSDQAELELGRARSTFYVPTMSKDALNNLFTTEFDSFSLLAIRTKDAIGNETAATKVDYASLKIVEVTDQNQNRKAAALNHFGEVSGSAMLGKVGEVVGDDLAGFDPVFRAEDAEGFLENPTGAWTLSRLKDAFSFEIHSFSTYYRTKNTEKPIPPFIATVMRNKHAHQNDEEPQISIKITYFDGYGEPLQEVSLVDISNGETQWRFEGWQSRNHERKVVRQFQPFFSSTHDFRRQSEDELSKKFFYDACGRLVGCLHEDHTWEKQHISPWSTKDYDKGDTVLISDPTKDLDLGAHFGILKRSSYWPSWYCSRMDAEDVVAWDKAAAAKSAAYHGCPTTVQLDHATREVFRSTPKNGVSIDQTTEYDARGNRRAEYDAFKRLIHIYEYDMQGQIIHDTGLDSTPSRTVYDHEGKPVLTFLGEAVQKRFTYDALSRQTAVRITIDNGKSALWKKTVYGETVADASQKNLKGMTFQVYDQSGVHTNTAFDFKGNLTSETVQLAADYKEMIDWTKDNNVLEKPVYTASFEYDGQNRTTTSTDAHGAITRKIYNQTGQLKTITWRGIRDSRWTSYVSRTSYTADGRVSKCEYGNGAVTTCTHDPATRLLTTQRTTRGSGAILEDISHYYDCNGRITHTINDAQKDVFFQGSHVGADKDFTYDSYGQLIQARGREQVHTQSGSIRSFQAYKSAKPSARSTLPGDGSQLASYTETYDYDLVGNLLQMRHEATTDRTIAGWTRSYSYSAPSQLDATQKSNKLTATEVGGVREEYSYAGHSGARGCMTSVPGYSSLTWDAQDMLRSSSTQVYKDGTPETTWYVYDSEGRRVRKVTERAAAKATSPVKLKETIDVLSSEFYFEYAGDGKTTSAEKRTSSVSGASVVALVENLMTPDGAKQFIRYRIGGNMELNESGQLISYEEYSPFGATTYAACAKDIEVSNRGRYSNYLRDEETGFYHCGARYFAPWLGRWISADPIGTGDGPNRYRYASNDPINMADPEGTCRNHRPDALDMFLGGAGLHPKIQSMWYAERTGGKTLQEHKVEQREIRRKDVTRLFEDYQRVQVKKDAKDVMLGYRMKNPSMEPKIAKQNALAILGDHKAAKAHIDATFPGELTRRDHSNLKVQVGIHKEFLRHTAYNYLLQQGFSDTYLDSLEAERTRLQKRDEKGERIGTLLAMGNKEAYKLADEYKKQYPGEPIMIGNDVQWGGRDRTGWMVSGVGKIAGVLLDNVDAFMPG